MSWWKGNIAGLNVSHFHCVGSFKTTRCKARINNSMHYRHCKKKTRHLTTEQCRTFDQFLGEQTKTNGLISIYVLVVVRSVLRSVSHPLLMQPLMFYRLTDCCFSSLNSRFWRVVNALRRRLKNEGWGITYGNVVSGWIFTCNDFICLTWPLPPLNTWSGINDIKSLAQRHLTNQQM